MDPVTTSAIIGGASSLLGSKGGQQTESGLTLPPAMYNDMIENSKSSIKEMDQDLAQFQKAIEAYDQRINLIQQGLNNQIPGEDLQRQLTENSANIAIALGASAEELVANGMLSQDDIDRIKELDEIRGGEYFDEEFDQQAQEMRDRLEQDIYRNNASDMEAQIMRQNLEQNLAVERQKRGEIYKEGAFGRALQTFGASKDAQVTNFNLATGAINASQGVLQNAQNVYNQQARYSGARLDAQNMNFQNTMAGRQFQQQTYANAGQYLNGAPGQSSMLGKYGKFVKRGGLAGAAVRGIKKLF